GGKTQIHARTTRQRQGTVPRVQFNDGAIRCLDDLAVAVHTQDVAVRIQHGAVGQGQSLFARQADAAHLGTGRIDGAVNGQQPVIQRNAHVARAHFVAKGQVALFDLEVAGAEYLAFGQTLVQCGEV